MTDIVDRLRDKHCCDDTCHCDEAAAEITRLRQNIRAEAFDMLHGTPCAEIRWQQERETLVADNERLRAALKRAAKELELLYFFAISNGIAEAGIPPHVEARAALANDVRITAQPAALRQASGGDND